MKFFQTNLLNFTYFLVTFLFVSFFSGNVFAENKLLWKSIGDQNQSTKQLLAKGLSSSLEARTMELDELNFKSLVIDGITSNTVGLAAKNTVVTNNKTINLPLPDGTEVSVIITPNSVMTASLAAQFPQIKTWDVKGVTKDITGTIDFTHRGFHGMLTMPDGDRVFIEPDFEVNTSNQGELSSQSPYISFSKKENENNFKSEFSCGAHDKHNDLSFAARPLTLARPSSDLITYRLAVATTGEYSQFHGGTVASTLSAIVTTINRVNQIYRRDLSIQFQLVDEQSDLIYLNPNTDPYTNSDVFKLIEENNTNLSSSGVLSKTRYDIGHVFGRGSVGGLAVVAGVCDNDEKAFGATGISSPVGDAFALDYVAHELGHQLGGTHTFNSACNGGSERTGITAVEPGSGTTIMAYPGICQANNIQNSVDPQFHIVSIDQIRSVTRSGGGSSCGVRTSTINENPTVNAGLDIDVPARTPLVFVANGADTDNDALTYSWEQSDTGTSTNLNVDSGDNALFRSNPLTSDNVRFIPSLSDLFSGTVSAGEVLPVTNREINMVATARDGKGGLQADLVKLQVFDTGEGFSVTSHTNNQSFGRDATTEVRWNVAGTNSTPISCVNVDIGLATVDGQGLDITTTANDGRATITIPNDAPPINNARFIISCNTSNFFNLSRGQITILDQVGGGTSSGGGGGGSFNALMLLFGFILVFLRNLLLPLKNVLKRYKNIIKLCFLSLPILASVQACSAPKVNNVKTNTDSAMPKEFGNRFSSENLKKEREAFYAQKRIELKSLNALTEVKRALQSNNIYLMVIAANRGTSLSVPGLLDPQVQSVNCRIQSVEGMGDVIYGKNHIAYRQEILRYMTEFNALMQSYCK